MGEWRGTETASGTSSKARMTSCSDAGSAPSSPGPPCQSRTPIDGGPSRPAAAEPGGGGLRQTRFRWLSAGCLVEAASVLTSVLTCCGRTHAALHSISSSRRVASIGRTDSRLSASAVEAAGEERDIAARLDG
eukprot:scaffold234_cov67-Phaeocystis_antarctica.AAC.2